jgi:hypothetical protein
MRLDELGRALETFLLIVGQSQLGRLSNLEVNMINPGQSANMGMKPTITLCSRAHCVCRLGILGQVVAICNRRNGRLGLGRLVTRVGGRCSAGRGLAKMTPRRRVLSSWRIHVVGVALQCQECTILSQETLCLS